MAPYIGIATPRIDGVAKVTGAAKYAAEFNEPGILHGSVVASTIAKGRITRIDTSAAKRVKGVLDVITHANRPQMADDDKAYKDDVAPSGSPFRPLYDAVIRFSGQPIALVVGRNVRGCAICGVAGPGGVREGDAHHRRVSPAQGKLSPSNRRQTRSRPCSRHRRHAECRSRRLPPRRYATKPNTTHRWSIITQWSCTQPR